MDYLFLILGLALLLAGAELLVDSSIAIAKRAKVSNFIIGLTIVGMGTSAPELFVSISSAITGHGDVAVGNVVGSNICNILLILGITAVIYPFNIDRTVSRRDIPFCIFASILLPLLACDKTLLGLPANRLSRLDGITMLMFFFGYMGYVLYKNVKSGRPASDVNEEETTSKLEGRKPALLWTIAAASLVGLIGGGQLFLNSATSLAHAWGISEAVISITIVAVGTSLPELITSVVAACKKSADLALGNIIGSNVFNILMILGLSATIQPFDVDGIRMTDYFMVILASVMAFLTVFTFKKQRLDRVEGIIFLIVYAAYTIYLLQ